MKQEEGRDDEMVGEKYKSLYSLQSIRVKLRAKSGGERGKRSQRKDKGSGWHHGKYRANMERGPIKSKAKESMNNLAVKHTWGDTCSMYVKAKML